MVYLEECWTDSVLSALNPLPASSPFVLCDIAYTETVETVLDIYKPDFVRNNDSAFYPSWIYADKEHYESGLSTLTVKQLQVCLGKYLKVPYASRYKRHQLISIISDHVQDFISDAKRCINFDIVAQAQTQFGIDAYSVLCTPPCHVCRLDAEILATEWNNRPWLLQDEHDQFLNMQNYTKNDIKKIILSLHPHRRSPYRPIITSMTDSVVHSFRMRAMQLACYSLKQLIEDAVSYDFDLVHFPHNKINAEKSILNHEFPFFSDLTRVRVSDAIRTKQIRLNTKLDNAHNRLNTRNQIQQDWPQLVPENIILSCMDRYRKGIQCKPLKICACCSRQRLDIDIYEEEISMQKVESLPLNINILKIFFTPPPKYLPYFQCFPPSFNLRDDMKDLLLEAKGIIVNEAMNSMVVHICQECKHSLENNQMPRFALANNLYRGSLPSEFDDLTWVEEMVCALFRTTAVVTRVFGSRNEKNAKIFKGNTCAHDVNIISTAQKLPRTPSDINDFLTVLFVGQKKKLKDALTPFIVRKSKISRLLQFLKENNVLHQKIFIDENIINMYPENGILPGLFERVIIDENTDPDDAFEEETAGIQNHPATDIDLQSTSVNVNNPLFFMDSTGATDPDGDQISGRSFIAAGLRNLLPPSQQKNNDCDLKIFHSNHAIVEYKNPSLLLGMFPTLFPFGIGGFEDPSRTSPISFENQAESYLDLSDRRFRYHHFYVFVVWNMIQRRKAHLSTFLSVKRSNFSSIANRLISVSADTIQKVANHLEHEHKLADMRPEEQEVMNLLNHVNTVSGKVPGSEASKLIVRNSIRSYFAYFGLPHVYFTLNPAPSHSPVFQFLFSDHKVDLSKQFPVMPMSAERALRLAKDPVAAADFFDFMVKAFFRYLLGWDFEHQCSTPEGGLLGFLEVFCGTSEYTERGNLHGHFLIWLLGGMNPTDIHNRLKSCKEFHHRFFDFWESVIKHDLPSVDCTITDSYEPRAELPPKCPSSNVQLSTIPTEENNNNNKAWLSELNTQIKMCGESFQRHTCKKVCHKYGHDSDCRFGFPHEIIPTSFFDEKSNSIFLKCLDPTINYYNPYIMISCRHNTDIRCILSGKAAKAAMFYISDYITKSDLKTYEVLSLLSTTVLNAARAQPDSASPVDQARTLLHKCLTQFSRRQQIHAQQAVRYLRKKGDAIYSHKTVPMLSGPWISYCARHFQLSHNEDGDGESEEPEDCMLKIHVNHEGFLTETNQIFDYLYRANELAHLNFYKFSQRTCLEKKTRSPKTDSNTRSGVYARFPFKDGHSQKNTHVLVLREDCDTSETPQIYIPRLLIGCSVPRKTNTESYNLFMLAHFKPCSIDVPLIENGQSLQSAFDAYSFDAESCRIMSNWDAIHECEDEREAERIRKSSSLMKKSKLLKDSVGSFSDDIDDCAINIPLTDSHQSHSEVEAVSTVLSLCSAGWFARQPTDIIGRELLNLDITSSTKKSWLASIKQQENQITNARKNISNIQSQELSVLPSITTSDPIQHQIMMTYDEPVKNTKTSKSDNSKIDVVNKIASTYNLNNKQKIAYNIMIDHFFKLLELRAKDNNSLIMLPSPLRMFLTGPGGTGKTHIVNAFKDIMKLYNSLHSIRFLAPTGSAASLINGSTIHSGLGIKIKRSPVEKNSNTLYVYTTVKNRTKLRDDWKSVDFLLIDEISMVSAELLCEIDHTLRYAKENYDTYFGGINMIFAGDFFQFPPIGATPLYHPLSHIPKTSSSEIYKRLGRLAWKSIDTVVELYEQERMRDDVEYANAVQHLRCHQCNLSDIDLFNSRRIKTPNYPDGIDLSTVDEDIFVIVNKNFVREIVNNYKAQAICSRKNSPTLIQCYANDVIRDRNKTNMTHITTQERQFLADLNISKKTSIGALPGILPLFIGAPVILRNKNISVNLGITNGQQGTLRHLKLKELEENIQCAELAIVEFPNSAVDIPGLPKNHFPIEPISCTITTNLPYDNNSTESITATRHQLPLQLAFAVTAHSAQGKTLRCIMCNLKDGGFAAYVSASRARTRFGLFTTEEVTLSDINTPINSNLLFETNRLKTLEENTFIRHGLTTDTFRVVPEPPSEFNQERTNFTIIYDEPPPSQSSSLRKRKRSKSADDLASIIPDKKIRPIPPTVDEEIVTPPTTQAIKEGIRWKNNFNTCAYDALFTLLWNTFLSFPDVFTTLEKNQTLSSLLDLFGQKMTRTMSLEYIRDTLVTMLTTLNPIAFPYQPINGIDLDDLCEAFFSSDIIVPILPTYGQHLQISFEHHVKSLRNINHPLKISFPPILIIRLHQCLPQLPTFLSLSNVIETKNYILRGIIYHGNFHFTARIFDSDNTSWYHDGMKSTNCINEHSQFTQNPSSYLKAGDRTAAALLYTI